MQVQYARLLFAKGRYAETAPLLDAVLQTLDGEGWGRLSADVAGMLLPESACGRRIAGASADGAVCGGVPARIGPPLACAR
eukprot:2542631-Rhodomonas_salina.1